MDKELPKPWNRKLILILDQFHKDDLEMSQEGKELLKNDEIFVISVDELSELQDKINVLGKVKLAPNIVLTISPFADRAYLDISESKELIPLFIATSTVKLCQLLGVKSIEFLNLKIINKKDQSESTIDLNSPLVKGEIDIVKKTFYNLKNKLSIKSEFEGGEAQIEKAELYLKENGLSGDPILCNLIELRKDSDMNKPKSMEYELSLTEALTKNLNLAASVKYIATGLKGAYNSLKEETVDIYLKIGVKF